MTAQIIPFPFMGAPGLGKSETIRTGQLPNGDMHICPDAEDGPCTSPYCDDPPDEDFADDGLDDDGCDNDGYDDDGFDVIGYDTEALP